MDSARTQSISIVNQPHENSFNVGQKSHFRFDAEQRKKDAL